ncbi:hypothetical protein [Actinomycetospora sp. CA-053990]|uniref:hypothetical protein n=1 Tax=Actinomycetospora sp. CA-053990 TaxID=3239891 RepID=UPI003D92D741
MARGDLTKGWLRGPGFVPLAPDVYVPSDVLVDQVTMARVAMLRHPEGTIAGTTAALFHGAIDAVVDVGRGGAPTEVLVPASGTRSLAGLRVRCTDLPGDEVVEWPDGTDGAVLRLTSPARTLVEVARALPTVEAVVVGDALARRCGVTPAEVVELADRHTGERGMARVRAAAALMHPGSDTPRRTRVRLGVLRARLPPPLVDVVVTRAEGSAAVGSLDLSWPERSCGVLVDRHPDVAWACAEELLAHGWEVASIGRQGEQAVDEVVEDIATFLARVDRLRWRDLPDMRGRFPRRPSAPKVFD